MIKSASMNYGRWKNDLCPHETVNANTAPFVKLYDLPNAIGKASYQLNNAKNIEVNEDPYPGVYKHWQITYRCG